MPCLNFDAEREYWDGMNETRVQIVTATQESNSVMIPPLTKPSSLPFGLLGSNAEAPDATSAKPVVTRRWYARTTAHSVFALPFGRR